MLLIIFAICIILFFVIRPYVIKYDTVLSFTGGLGSGKSFMSTQYARILLRKNRIRVFIHNLFKKDKWEKPLLYSSIPLRVSFKEYATILTVDHCLLQARIIPRSVVFIDEVDVFANQFEFKNPNLIRTKDSDGAFDEFVRLFRHYTEGGYLVVNTQCSENIVLTIRRRMNRTYNLSDFRMFPDKPFTPFVYWVKIREISLSEDIKSVSTSDLKEDYRLHFGFVPFFRLYDTYCYSKRYDGVTELLTDKYNQLKTYKFLRVPYKHLEARTLNSSPVEEEEP